jgi:hypothetical protein
VCFASLLALEHERSAAASLPVPTYIEFSSRSKFSFYSQRILFSFACHALSYTAVETSAGCTACIRALNVSLQPCSRHSILLVRAGMVLVEREGNVVVEEVNEGSHAQQAGIQVRLCT